MPVQTPTGLPFDDIRQLIATMPGADTAAGDAARERQGQLVKPPGALGRMEEIAIHLAT